MGGHSDNRGEKPVSATAASRSFSMLLDQVETGRRFLVHRRGRAVCVMAPPPVEGRRASEILLLLRARPPVLLDGGFGKEILRMLQEEQVEDRPSWGS